MATKRIYLDTCVFIAVAVGESERLDAAYSTLKAASSKRFQAVISGLVRAEAVGTPDVRNPQGKPPRKGREQITTMEGLFNESCFEYVDLTQSLGARAARMAADLGLRGPDACHLQMALISGCDEFYTYDSQLLRKNDLVNGLVITQPEIWPFTPSLLDI